MEAARNRKLVKTESKADEENCSPCWRRERNLNPEEACWASRLALSLTESVTKQHLVDMIAWCFEAYYTHEVSFCFDACCYDELLQYSAGNRDPVAGITVSKSRAQDDRLTSLRKAAVS